MQKQETYNIKKFYRSRKGPFNKISSYCKFPIFVYVSR